MSDVLVIIPTYNEIENIAKILETVMKYPDNFDVLVIDDNSPDGTADAVKSMMALYPGRIFLEQRTGKLGLGTAYIHGFKWALARDLRARIWHIVDSNETNNLIIESNINYSFGLIL